MKSKVHSSRLNRFISIMPCLLIACLVCWSLPVSALAESADELAKSANKLIRDAERNMHKGKIDHAKQLIEESQAMLDALRTADPSHRQLKSLESKYARTKKQIDKKLNRDKTKSPPPVKAEKPSGDKLPSGVLKRIKDIGRGLDRVDRYLAKGTDSSLKQANYKLSEAGGLFDEINKKYSNQFDADHPDYIAIKKRFDALQEQISAAMAEVARKKTDAQTSEAAREKQSAEWIRQFQAYLSYPGIEGHNPDLLVYVPGTSEPEKFADAQMRYEAFKVFYATYKNTEFPNGRTSQLATLADREAPQRLADFERQFANRINEVAGYAEKQISQAMAHLKRETAWKSDSTVKPPIVDKKRMVSIDNLVQKVDAALGAGSSEAEKIKDAYAALVSKDKEHRNIRADRTFLYPDVYKDGDKKVLQKKARDIVAKERQGATILRITIYKNSWEEKTIRGWTDTSRTEWTKKTFKQINAHVGAKDASGVYLYTLHLAKDKTESGWPGTSGDTILNYWQGKL